MTRTYRTSKGGPTEIRSYVKRANEFWRYAAEARRNQDHDACVMLSIHSCISLADAACVAQSGARYAGSSHEEAVQYFHDLGLENEGFKRACRRFGQMIGEKTTAEYGGRNLTEKESESIFKNGERLREFLLETILKDYYSG